MTDVVDDTDVDESPIIPSHGPLEAFDMSMKAHGGGTDSDSSTSSSDESESSSASSGESGDSDSDSDISEEASGLSAPARDLLAHEVAQQLSDAPDGDTRYKGLLDRAGKIFHGIGERIDKRRLKTHTKKEAKAKAKREEIEARLGPATKEAATTTNATPAGLIPFANPAAPAAAAAVPGTPATIALRPAHEYVVVPRITGELTANMVEHCLAAVRAKALPNFTALALSLPKYDVSTAYEATLLAGTALSYARARFERVYDANTFKAHVDACACGPACAPAAGGGTGGTNDPKLLATSIDRMINDVHGAVTRTGASDALQRETTLAMGERMGRDIVERCAAGGGGAASAKLHAAHPAVLATAFLKQFVLLTQTKFADDSVDYATHNVNASWAALANDFRAHALLYYQ